MKNKIKTKTRLAMFLLLLGMGTFVQGQEALITKYHQVMNDFLSHDCMSFDMTTVQYADLEGKEVLEKIEYQVVKSNDIWYLITGDYEVIFSKDYLVTIDNTSQTIHLETKYEVTPAQIFSNPSGMGKVFEYLHLTGEERTVIGGRKVIEFKSPSGNETTIQLEYQETGPIVERITATIDMTNYDELDHALDGMKLESIYSSVRVEDCTFDDKIKAIIESQFAVLQNRKSFKGYLIN